MIRVALIVMTLSVSSLAVAQTTQDRAIVLEDAPIYLEATATARQPIRTAATGSNLVVVRQAGEWFEVQFEDPQFGRRTGFIEARFVRVDRGTLRPVDLSVPATPAAQGPPPPVQPSPPPPAPQQPTAPPIPQAQRRIPARSGFWFNAGVGFGTFGCETCGDDRANGFSGGLSAGGTVGQRWLLGGGTTGWYREEDGVWLNAGTFDFRVRFYPVLTSGFFVNAGIGLGTVSIGVGRDSISETGAGAMLGLGWDLRVARNVSLTPFWNGSGISTSSLNANFGQLGLGVTIH